MQGGLKNTYDSIKAFSESDFTEDLKKFDVPTLVMHGEDDQVVPIKDSAKKSARLIKGAQENTRWSSQFGTLPFKCIGPRVEPEMHEHDRYP